MPAPRSPARGPNSRMKPRLHEALRSSFHLSARDPSLKVLIVEDQFAVLEALRQILRSIDPQAEVTGLSTERQATGWLEQHSKDWDLLLIDLFLAEGHGFNVLRHCVSRTPSQRVALISNYVGEPVRERALQAGADAFFDKTRDIDGLIDFCTAASRQARVRQTSA
ncbi:MAG: response regulator [Comamonadaceae bacterium]|nr:MAG: response regulator [Comamonadaceae bacterium]